MSDEGKFICKKCYIVTDIKNLCGHYGGHLYCDKCCDEPYNENK